jgi:hypothetical protein
MSAQSLRINDSLFLVNYTPNKVAAQPAVEVPTDHLLVIDCSGSMSWELPKIRDQLKRKLPKMVGEKDTVSIVWFSGRGQCGVLIEGEPVATLTDLAAVNKAIDRWLSPVGLTGFKEPLEEVGKLADRLKKARPQAATSLFFLSDGCDNQSSRAEILKAIDGIAAKLNAATIVEYGYYADRNLLSSMAEKVGGSLIFSEGFDKYAPILEASLAKKVTGAPKIEVPVPNNVVGGFAFALEDGDLLTFAVENGKVRVPEGVKNLGYLTPQPDGEVQDFPVVLAPVSSQTEDVRALAYAALSLYATRMNSNVVFALLKALGDVTYIEMFANCFGKQAYSAFQQSAKLAAFSQNLRLTKGYDPNKVPREDAFTVLELLHVLSSDDGNRLMLDHKDFKYSRIGRGRVDSNTVLTAEEQAEVDALSDELSQTKDVKKVLELSQKIAAIANKPEALKFQVIDNPDGYEVNGLVWNEERPNVSVRVVKQGTVDITSRLKDCPASALEPVPAAFPSYIFRNYTIIKDGLVNVEVLPVRLTNATKARLTEAFMQGRAPESLVAAGEEGIVLLNLKDLPVINRQMVRATSAKLLFQLEWELTKARAAQKVFKAYKEDLVGKRKSEAFLDKYGAEPTAWLKELGFTDYSGFAPKVVQADSTDFYMSKEMGVSIKSYGSLPTLKAAREKKAKGKPYTPSEALIAQYIDQVEGVLTKDDGATEFSEAQKRMLLTWLEEETRASIALCRDLMFKKAQLLFSVIVGQSWFSEFASLDQNSMSLDLDGQALSCKVEMSEKEVKI